MKKILGLTIAIVLIIGLVAGGTFAYFSDIERSTGNTFTAGIIDIELSHIDGVEGAFIDIDDIKPCQVKYGFFDIHGEEGTNPGPVFIHITGVETAQGTQSDAEEEAEGDNPVHNIDDWMTISLIVVTERPPGEPTAEEMAAWLAEPANVDEVIIHHDDHMKLSDLESAIIPVGFIEGYSSRIWLVMDLHLQAETGNEYQGDTCSFTVEAIMTQVGVPPPVVSGNKIILENKDAASNWQPILGDGKWGIVKYDVSSLTLTVWAQGLDPNTAYQLGIDSPEAVSWYPVSGGETMRVAMASALAGGVYDGTTPTSTVPPTGFNLYERGYYTSGAAMLHGGAYVSGDTGAYYFTNSGTTAAAVTTDANGKLNGQVRNCTLPSGDYEYIKVLIKKDSSPWTAELMEKTTPLFFNIP